MSHRLAYAGCLHRLDIDEKGYLQIEIFTYESRTERFVKAIEKPLIPSTVMIAKQCTVMSSAMIDKGLLVLVRLLTSNSSILMLLRLQPRPWSCHILHTLAIPSTIHASLRSLATNSHLSLFVTDEPNRKGFYRMDNREISQRTLEFIPCLFLSYFSCHLKESYYWLMGSEMDANTGRTVIKVYYHSLTSPPKSLIAFDTKQFFPLTLTDNTEDVYVINHQIQLKTRSIVGDLIISSTDHRIFTSHHGRIVHQMAMSHLITSIQAYRTIEDEQLYLLVNRDLQSVEIFQYEQNYSLVPFNHSDQTAVEILVDDFTQIGWKQILFIENDQEINAFHLTDFSHIHVFQQESDVDFDEKNLSVEMNDDGDVQASLVVAQDLLRKKLISADFIVNEGYFQCRQINNDIRRLANKHHIPDLSSHVWQSDSNSTHLQLIGTHWFVYRTTVFIHLTIKNLSNTSINSVFVFAVDRSSNKIKEFDLKSSHPSFFSTETTFACPAQSAITFILTTSIELDREMDFDLYLLVNDTQKLARLGSIQLSIDDLIHSKHQRVLKMTDFDADSASDTRHQQALIYLNTLSRLGVQIESKSKIYLIEDIRRLLANLGFQALRNTSNAYLRLDEGNIFEHALVHLLGEDEFMTDDLIVQFYAENIHQTTMLAKYLLSKLDFQSFSLIDPVSDPEEQTRLNSRIQCELLSYADGLKQLPTIMRRVAPALKSESYRLFKAENFQFFRNERHQTDLFLAASIID